MYKRKKDMRYGLILSLSVAFSFMMGVQFGSKTFDTESIVTEPTNYVTDTYYTTIELEEPIFDLTKPVEKEKLTPQIISANFDILKPSGYTSEELASALSTNNHKALLPYIDTFIEAENIYGVNAFYLLCKLGYESGWGRYMSGQNNIAGWTNGKGGYKNFASVDECILYVAEKLSTTYKDAIGTRLEDVCWRYNPSHGYLTELLTIMKQRQNVILSKM